MRFRCYACRLPLPGNQFREFESDRPSCPGCGAGEQAVVELEDVHFLVLDPRGPVAGRDGRYRVGCEPKREQLALDTHDTYAATGDPRAVTCPSCKGLPEWKAAARAVAARDKVYRKLLSQEPGCCG